MNSPEINLFIDSGAFSADSQGKPVVLEDYISFLHSHKDVIDIYPVLDVIGDAKATWRNQEVMQSEGLTPMPVFHVEDDMHYLHRCLDYEYFCLGGMAGGASSATRQAFLNRCFEIICDTPDRMPKCKVHGFGLASPSLMTAYPFYSVDTSSWVAYSQYGIILVPQFDRYGKPQYGKTPNKVFVTERSPKCQEEGLHIKNVTGVERAFILDYMHHLKFDLGSSTCFKVEEGYELQENEIFNSKCKTNVERADVSGVSNSNSLRYAYNLAYFNAIAEACPAWPWPWSPKIKSFF